MSRLLKGYASNYGAAQVQNLRVRRYQDRHLQVDFNGALDRDEVIQEVRWDATSPWATAIYDASVDEGQKVVRVGVSFNFAGWGAIKATVQTNQGNTLNYEFFITVKDAPLYPAAVYDLANGPFYLIATA
ncbi:hypothetical protein M8R20_26265 [Pseudomonas sp. R2.Fl]|nr:hypothetical protein [Pseudomonas sp. R2.Fl]